MWSGRMKNDKERSNKTEDMFDGDVVYRCSECKELFCIIEGTPKDNEYNYCPHCGCRMIKESEG